MGLLFSFFKDSLVVFVIDINSFFNSSQSDMMESYSFLFKYLERKSTSSQYIVSAVSFRDM